jgi:dolichol kinase
VNGVGAGPAAREQGGTPNESSYSTELIRKGIHLTSGLIPLFYHFNEKSTTLWILAAVTCGALAIDLLRFSYPPFRRVFYSVVGFMLRSHETESGRFNGATYVLVSATLSVLIFPKPIAITAFTVLILADMMAALAGRKFGRHRFLAKSLEGSAAFFVTALLVTLVVPPFSGLPVHGALAAVAALSATVVEACGWRLDDNFTVPLTVGAILWAGYSILYGELGDLGELGGLGELWEMTARAGSSIMAV